MLRSCSLAVLPFYFVQSINHSHIPTHTTPTHAHTQTWILSLHTLKEEEKSSEILLGNSSLMDYTKTVLANFVTLILDKLFTKTNEICYYIRVDGALKYQGIFVAYFI